MASSEGDDHNSRNRPDNFYANDPKAIYRNIVWQPDAFLSKNLPQPLVVGLLPKLSLYQKRYLTVLLLVRSQAVPLFAELRKEQTIFKIPGDIRNGFRDVILISRYKNGMESFGTDAKGTIVDVPPPNLKVPYDEYSMDETVHGAFMLGRDGESLNSSTPHSAHMEKRPQQNDELFKREQEPVGRSKNS